MIYQADFITDSVDTSGLYSDIGVKIHGAAMGAIKRSYAEFLHCKEYHPFSIFTVPADERIIIRVSALNDEAHCVIEGFRRMETLTIYGLSEPIRIAEYSTAPPISAAAVGELITGDECRMAFVSPAMFKSGGKICCFPEPQRYFYSVICKYNMFESDELSYEEFCAAFADGETGDYQLSRSKYNVSGNVFFGMTGYIDYRFPRDSRSRELLKRVLAYAAYCGVGGKTGMGMGGFVIA